MTLSVQTSFHGGEWSKRSQGRFDTPEYKTAMAVCRNGMPMEDGVWTRRPGTRYAGHTKAGRPGRITRYDFNALAPYQLEFTDNALRFRKYDGFVFDTSVTISAITLAGLFTASAVHGFAVGDEISVLGLGASCPQLHNRQLAIATVPSPTTFTVTDPITGEAPTILEAFAGTATAQRIMALATSYSGSAWQNLNVVRVSSDAIFLNGAAPKLLKVRTSPGPNSPGSFQLQNVYLSDGPYLDPVANGAILTPSATSGNVGFACAFPTYSATSLYKTGDCVTSASVNYISLADNNVGNTPASSPSYWAAGTASDILGVTQADVGRLVRLKNGSTWTWAQISSVQNQVSIVDPSATLTAYTDMGNAIIVDGGGQRGYGASAFKTIAAGTAPAAGTSVNAYVGATLSSSKPITNVTIYPSSDRGWGYTDSTQSVSAMSISIELYNGATGALLNAVSGISVGSTSAVSLSCSTTTNLIYAYIRYNFGASSNGFNFNAGNVSIYCSQFVIAQTSTSSTSAAFNARIRGAALPDTSAISTWRLGAYSDAIGWPTCGTWHEGRLWLGGVYPNRIDGSNSNDPFNFAPTAASGTVADSNAINYTFNSPDVSPVYWLEPDLQGLIVGTKTGEWLVQATTQNPALTPTNVKATRGTAAGASGVLPVRTEHTLAFVQNEERKVMELFADSYSGKFTAPHLTARARHLTIGGVAQLTYQKEPMPVLWARTGIGALIGATYKRDTMTTAAAPTFNGWHRHDLGSERTIEWVSTGPGTTGALNSLALVTSDGSSRHVEVLDQFPEETDGIDVGLLLDDAVQPSALENVTVAGVRGVYLHGLWHLNGETVTVWASGLDVGDFAVELGRCFVPYGSGVAGSPSAMFSPDFAASATIWVGFTFTSQGQLLRPQDTAPQSGFAKTRRANQFGIQLDRTATGIKIGTDLAKLRPIKLRTKGGQNYGPLDLWGGVMYDPLEDEYSLDSQVAWEITRPRPATVVAIGEFGQTQDR